MTNANPHDYPLSLSGAHGRIDAYRAALTRAAAILDDVEESGRLYDDPALLEDLRAAHDEIRAELAVTTP